MIALFANLLAFGLSRADAERDLRRLLPLATAIAAEIAALSVGGAVWLFTGLLGAGVILALTDARLLARRAVALAGVGLAVSVPAVVIGGTFVGPGNIGVLTSGTELGNLIRPLDRLQVFGIWPSATSGLRRRPRPDLRTARRARRGGSLRSVVCLAWPRLAAAPLCVDVLGGLRRPRRDRLALDRRQGDGDGLDGAPAGRARGCAVFFERGRRIEAVVAAAVDRRRRPVVERARLPRRVARTPARLESSQSIGDRFAGAGPTLMTEYQPYGVRHFLRRMEPESAGELRRRLVPLLDGQGVPKGGYADLDEFQTSGILVYKTLVLRRSPSESRPPSNYQLAWRGRYYEVWQRPDGEPGILRTSPSAMPFSREGNLRAATSSNWQRSQELRVDWHPLRGGPSSR